MARISSFSFCNFSGDSFIILVIFQVRYRTWMDWNYLPAEHVSSLQPPISADHSFVSLSFMFDSSIKLISSQVSHFAPSAIRIPPNAWKHTCMHPLSNFCGLKDYLFHVLLEKSRILYIHFRNRVHILKCMSVNTVSFLGTY